MDISIGGTYLNQKDKEYYKVLNILVHAETSERFVQFVSLTHPDINWTLPMGSFFEPVFIEGQQTSKFKLI